MRMKLCSSQVNKTSNVDEINCSLTRSILQIIFCGCYLKALGYKLCNKNSGEYEILSQN